jgi:hypothetical protein
MLDRVLADLVLVTHLAFVLFVVFGGLLALRRPRVAWIHVPAAAWGVFVEWSGWLCPLTPLESALRERSGEAGYAGGFLEHWVTALLYPAGLTRSAQLVLGALALAINLAVYGAVLSRAAQRRRRTNARPSRGASGAPGSSPRARPRTRA